MGIRQERFNNYIKQLLKNHVQTLICVLLTCLVVCVGGSGFAKSSVLRAQEGCRRLTVNV